MENKADQKRSLITTSKPQRSLDSISNIAVRTHLAEPTISNIEMDDLIKPLQGAILAIAQRLGIKLGVIEVQDLSRFTCQHFKDMTIQEIALAFDLLAAQKFEIKSQGHFGILSLEYYGQVLNGYKKYRIEETRKANINVTSTIQDTEEQTKEKNEKAMRSGIIQSWKYYQENSRMEAEPSQDIISALHYDWLRAKGIMEKPDGKDKHQTKVEAYKYLEDQLRLRQMNANRNEMKQINQQIKEIRNTNQFIQTCAKISLRKYFEQCITEKIDLETIIKNEK